MRASQLIRDTVTKTYERHLPHTVLTGERFTAAEIRQDNPHWDVGYVRGVQCGLGHSGNTGLAAAPGDQYAECQGCRSSVTVAEVRGAPSDGRSAPAVRG